MTPPFFGTPDHSAYYAAGDKGTAKTESLQDAKTWAAQRAWLSIPVTGSVLFLMPVFAKDALQMSGDFEFTGVS